MDLRTVAELLGHKQNTNNHAVRALAPQDKLAAVEKLSF
jgi:hypothetical protein